ncbi:MAG TPA: Fur family transcriptional regulator [Rhizomicrobium sp.]|jgi:Fur family iron response transcriptional regulator|nr:Fur family transcriptional regulator [Rhizomicrobium sp.]HVX57692.1 Fur family transcriptional regulator [Candidatus Saccharimonadales bacterium]
MAREPGTGFTRQAAKDAPRHGAALARLKGCGLRPTRQRLDLARLLFRDGDRHVTAESLHDEVSRVGIKVSLATVYNTLHQFTEAGLLRQVVVDAGRSYFDTNVDDHQHFFLEEDGVLIDIPGETIEVSNVPVPPEGLAVDRVDVVVRVKRS